MADQDRMNQEYRHSTDNNQDIPNDLSRNREEAAEEIAAPVSLVRSKSVGPDEKEYRENSEVSKYHTPASKQFQEETAGEVVDPSFLGRTKSYDHLRGKAGEAGTGIGFLGLALSVISLFVMPVLFGAAGIVLGFVARKRGAEGLGSWAIGVGVASLVISIFILPFF